MKDGFELLVKFGANTLVGLRSNDLSLSVDMIEITTKDSNKWKEYLAGQKGGTVSVEQLYDPTATTGSISHAFADLVAGTKLVIAWGGVVATETYYECDGFISSLSISGPDNDAASYSVEVQLTGAVTSKTVAA